MKLIVYEVVIGIVARDFEILLDSLTKKKSTNEKRDF